MSNAMILDLSDEELDTVGGGWIAPAARAAVWVWTKRAAIGAAAATAGGFFAAAGESAWQSVAEVIGIE